MAQDQLARGGELVVEGQGPPERQRVVGLHPRVLDAPADLARAARGVVRAAPAEVLDDRRHLGPDDAVLVMVPARVGGEVLADLDELPA